MNVTIDLSGGDDVVRIRIDGDIDFYSAPEVVRSVRPAASAGSASEVRIDLDAVGFLSAEGIGALTRLVADASKRGLRVRVVDARSQPHKLIQQMGAHQLLGGDAVPSSTTTHGG
jgi:anti-sigma B factor antagonist